MSSSSLGGRNPKLWLAKGRNENNESAKLSHSEMILKEDLEDVVASRRTEDIFSLKRFQLQCEEEEDHSKVNVILIIISVTRKKLSNVHKSCPKMISLEK